MTTLVIAEHDNAQLKGATLNTIAAASRLGGEVHVLVAGSGAQAVAEQAAQAARVSKVLLADAPQLAEGLAENLAAQVLAVAGGTATFCSRPRPRARTWRRGWRPSWMWRRSRTSSE
ncbi:electron transfer flavoprotein subunit alpha [Bordetella pertussis]|nr:electron transfer flavoprotein subunit alpha [Bordetella pertussis]